MNELIFVQEKTKININDMGKLTFSILKLIFSLINDV